MRFHAAGIVPGRTAHQPLPVAVGGVAQPGGHELFKDEVDARHHLRRRAEIRVQRQQGIGAGGARFRAGLDAAWAELQEKALAAE